MTGKAKAPVLSLAGALRYNRCLLEFLETYQDLPILVQGWKGAHRFRALACLAVDVVVGHAFFIQVSKLLLRPGTVVRPVNCQLARSQVGVRTHRFDDPPDPHYIRRATIVHPTIDVSLLVRMILLETTRSLSTRVPL